MRNCKKNLRKMKYALYSDKIPVYDDEGNLTIETTTGYLSPVSFEDSLSSGTSNSDESPFGSDVTYDRVISTTDMSLPIDEHSIIWCKNEPVFKNDGSVDGSSADYQVAAPPLDGLNSLRIAIRNR